MAIERVVVFGSCQIVGIAAAIKQRFPAAAIDGFHVDVHPTPAAELADQAARYDLIVTQFVDKPDHPLSAASLARLNVPIVQIPVIVFSGFHPDLIYLASEGRALEGPFGAMQPALAVAGHMLGLSEDRVASLYNAYVYASLEYFAEAKTSRRELEARFAAFGLDISACFERWKRLPGAFMYTINHPRVEVIADITRLALRNFGEVPADDAYPADALAASAIWHVLPEIAARSGTTSNAGYSLAAAPSGERRTYSQREFIHKTFEALSSVKSETLAYGRMKFIAEALDRLLVRGYEGTGRSRLV